MSIEKETEYIRFLHHSIPEINNKLKEMEWVLDDVNDIYDIEEIDLFMLEMYSKRILEIVEEMNKARNM